MKRKPTKLQIEDARRILKTLLPFKDWKRLTKPTVEEEKLAKFLVRELVKIAGEKVPVTGYE